MATEPSWRSPSPKDTGDVEGCSLQSTMPRDSAMIFHTDVQNPSFAVKEGTQSADGCAGVCARAFWYSFSPHAPRAKTAS